LALGAPPTARFGRGGRAGRSVPALLQRAGRAGLRPLVDLRRGGRRLVVLEGRRGLARLGGGVHLGPRGVRLARGDGDRSLADRDDVRAVHPGELEALGERHRAQRLDLHLVGEQLAHELLQLVAAGHAAVGGDEVAQCLGQLGAGVKAALRHRVDRPHDDRVQPRVEPSIQPRRRWQRLAPGGHVAALAGRLAQGEQLVPDRAQRVDVAGGLGLLAAGQLGPAVAAAAARAVALPQGGDRVEGAQRPEVADRRPAFSRQQHVARGDRAVHHAGVVRPLHRLAEVDQEVEGQRRLEQHFLGVEPLQRLAQVEAVDVLADHRQPLADQPDLHHVDEPRIRQRVDHPADLGERLGVAGVGGLLVKQLDHHRLGGVADGLVELGELSAFDSTDEPVFGRHSGTGQPSPTGPSRAPR
jgi:hypothetical protein